MAMPILDYCDACLGPVGSEPFHVSEMDYLGDQMLSWNFCSEECVLSGLTE